jgi:acyl-CoA reductase-like NAD-dependent aldehyde dehydrogenase
MITVNSLIMGKVARGAKSQINTGPINGAEISELTLLSSQELVGVFQQAKKNNSQSIKTDYLELLKLAKYFKDHRTQFIEQIIIDSGFIYKDAEDLVDCSIEFCEDYGSHIGEIATRDQATSFSFLKGQNRKIKLTSSPYGLISATTPRNTPLITELTIIVHALWSGNVLVLRPSPGVAGTVALLIEGLMKTFYPQTLQRLNIVFSDAKEFVSTSLDYANLLHYVGSTKYLEDTLISGIKKGVKVLVDGDGCSLVIVDNTSNLEEAAKACYQGLVRCNGQICVSVRAIVVEQKVYEKFLFHFLDLIKKTVVLPPDLNKQVDMGPLFTFSQAENILHVAKKYRFLSGQQNQLSYGQNYISPIVVELSSDDNVFLRESVFGPIVGVSCYKGDGWKRWLEENPINLTDTVFSKDKKFIDEFLVTSKSPRKVVNLDPTIESVFEPWGAFLPSGWNDVSYWFHKYRNYYQVIRA